MSANDNDPPRPLRFSARAAAALGLLTLGEERPDDRPGRPGGGGETRVVLTFRQDELEQLRHGLERLARDLREAGL